MPADGPPLSMPHEMPAVRLSLRRQLLRLAFTPLAVVFPIILGVLVGGSRFDARLESMGRGQLAAARSYLDQQRTQAAFVLASAGLMTDDARFGIVEALHFQQRMRSADFVVRSWAPHHQAFATQRFDAT